MNGGLQQSNCFLCVIIQQRLLICRRNCKINNKLYARISTEAYKGLVLVAQNLSSAFEGTDSCGRHMSI